MNQVMLMGRLTANPEIKAAANGSRYVFFSIAVEREFKKEGENRVTDFFRCASFGKTAEFIGKYFNKGAPIALIGRLEQERWTTRAGDSRESIRVVVLRAYFCAWKRNTAQPDNNECFSEYVEIDDEELPF